MNAREFYEAVKAMRKADKAYYSYKAPLTDPQKQALLKEALDAENIVDNEIDRVEAVINPPQQQKLSL